MFVTLLPIMALAASTPASTTYAYAYDAQRSPAFPGAKGDEIELCSFNKPLKYGSEYGNKLTYTSNEGAWTLTEVGIYSEKSSFYPAPTDNLDGVVSSVADAYDLNTERKNGILIHKLTDEGNNLIGYGVVIGVDETNGYALFIGDLWNSGGAGYLLSNSSITADSIKFTTEQMAQSTYSVELDKDAISFTEATEGYSVPAPEAVTVTNTGDAASGDLSISLSGGESSAFTLSESTISDIAVSGDKIMPVTAIISDLRKKEDKTKMLMRF